MDSQMLLMQREAVENFVKRRVETAHELENEFEKECRETVSEKQRLLTAVANVEQELQDGKFRESELLKRVEAERVKIAQARAKENQIPDDVRALQAKKRELERLKTLKANEVIGARRTTQSEAVNQLTTKARLFQKLGLRFERVGGTAYDELRMIFVNVDPRDHSREFKIVIRIDSEDKYHIVESSPRLPKTSEMLKDLNKTNEFGVFARRVRLLFKNVVAGGD